MYLKYGDAQMKKFEVNEIPQLLESREITQKEATEMLWVDIYFNREKYNLKELDEDGISDFLLTYRRRFPNIMRKYDKRKADFTTFMRSCMMQFKSSWNRKRAKAWTESMSVENSMRKSGDTTDFSFEEETIDAMEREANAKTGKEERQAEDKRKEEREVRETALVLALKSCRYIDDSMVAKLSKFTKKNEEDLHKIIDGLKTTMEKKERIQNLMIMRRNKSFFKKRKLNAEMEHLEEDCGEYKKVKSLYENQLRSWKRTNETLTHRYVMSPKNSEIARIMGISIRKVYYCISHAKDEEKMRLFQQMFRQGMEESAEE